MSSDRITQLLLGVIALALTIIALRPAIPVAHAADTMRCTIDGPLVVSDFRDTLKVEVSSAFSAPGSNSSSPLYVQVRD